MFDNVGFNKVENVVFRQLVKARLTYPASKAAIVEYLKNHFDKDVSLSKIYRYLDKLSDSQHEVVQNISVLHHTKRVLDDHIDVLFYDVTTLYCKSDHEDELRKTGFSKEGRHKNPQIILGLLVSIGGYPLAYCIHEGNKYEGHTIKKDAYNREKGLPIRISPLVKSTRHIITFGTRKEPFVSQHRR